MNLVDAGEPPECLVRPKLHTKQRMPRDRTPAIAVAVDRQGRVPSEVFHAHEAHAVETHHHAGAASGEHCVVVGEHAVEPVADVEGHHHLAARRLGRLVHRFHHRLHAVGERRVRRIRHQLVVLHEVDTGESEGADEVGGLPRREADARLDDRADDWPPLHGCEPARALDSELRPGELRSQIGRQRYVQKFQARQQPEFKEVARHHGGDGRQARRHVLHGERHPHAAAGVPPRWVLGGGCARH